MKKNLINVTDLSSYIYCPRKYYLEKIKGLKQAPTKVMIEGKIRHEILEEFGKTELKFLENFELINKEFTKKKMLICYENFVKKIIEDNFKKNMHIIKNFKINENEFASIIFESMKEEIELRAESVDNAIKKGFFGKELILNLIPKYASEFYLESETLGIKGRADRIVFSDLTNKNIIPFELKTREIQKIYLSDEIQLACYSLLLEEKFCTKIPVAILQAGNKKFEVLISSELRQKVFDLIEQIRDIEKNLVFPSNFSKCQTCAYEKECGELKVISIKEKNEA
ncbi:MAG: PD-(D/E)XK nuclease family protein [Nanoarchaeota archaeon]